MQIYRKLTSIVFLAFSMCGYAIANEAMPRSFMGEWASNCKEPGDGQLIITSSSISPYEGSCKIENFLKRSKASISVKVYCSVEGIEAPGTSRLSIANGKLKYSIESNGDVYDYRGTVRRCR